MKKLWLFTLLLSLWFVLPTFAQTVEWQYIRKTIAAGDVDSLYFPFRSKSFFENPEPDSIAINPPDEVYNDDASVISIRRISHDSTASDSTIGYVKGLDAAGRIVQNDSVFVFGTSFAAPGTPNKFGNGGVHMASLAGLLGKYNGVVLIVKVFDLTGIARRYEFGHGIP